MLHAAPMCTKTSSPFQQSSAVHILMELCVGGELFERTFCYFAAASSEAQPLSNTCSAVHIVMELCLSGELFERTKKKFQAAASPKARPLSNTHWQCTS